jgi:hypothetical protein
VADLDADVVAAADEMLAGEIVSGPVDEAR